MHIDRYNAASGFLNDPKEFMSEMGKEQKDLLNILAQTSFYDRINRDSDLDARSSVFFQEDWVQKVFEKDSH